jgi:hypothetical protein
LKELKNVLQTLVLSTIKKVFRTCSFGGIKIVLNHAYLQKQFLKVVGTELVRTNFVRTKIVRTNVSTPQVDYHLKSGWIVYSLMDVIANEAIFSLRWIQFLARFLCRKSQNVKK